MKKKKSYRNEYFKVNAGLIQDWYNCSKKTPGENGSQRKQPQLVPNSEEQSHPGQEHSVQRISNDERTGSESCTQVCL